jgi:hypothetical protein
MLDICSQAGAPELLRVTDRVIRLQIFFFETEAKALPQSTKQEEESYSVN